MVLNWNNVKWSDILPWSHLQATLTCLKLVINIYNIFTLICKTFLHLLKVPYHIQLFYFSFDLDYEYLWIKGTSSFPHLFRPRKEIPGPQEYSFEHNTKMLLEAPLFLASRVVSSLAYRL